MELLAAIALLCQAGGTGTFNNESPNQAYARQLACQKWYVTCYVTKQLNKKGLSDQILLACVLER